MAVGELSFAFNPAAGETPETVKRKRMLAEAILGQASRAPKDVGEGLNAIGQALLYRKMMSDAGKGETAGASAASKIFQSLMGSNFPAPPPAATVAPQPGAVSDAAVAPTSSMNPDAGPAPTSSADLQPYQAALLDTIAGPESNGKYDIIYGGSRFNDFSDHPRKAVPIGSGPNVGRTSSAAGKYQFLAPTWDDQARKLGLKDFSPASQDKAAWNLAKESYKRATGGDLDAVLQSGDPQAIAGVGKALAPIWTSLPGGIEQGTNTSKFLNAYQGALGNSLGRPAPQDAVAAINAFAPTGKRVASLDPSVGLPAGDPYANIPARDGMGQDQIAKFRQWNSDPIANDPASMASVDPAMQGVIKRAKEIAGTDFVIGSGARTPETQKKAVDFGWSGTMDSDHLTGGAADLWPVDANGAVVFDKGKQQQIVAAMKQAATELGVDMEAGADWKKKDVPHFGMIGQTPINGPIPQQRPGGGSTVSPEDIARIKSNAPTDGSPYSGPGSTFTPQDVAGSQQAYLDRELSGIQPTPVIAPSPSERPQQVASLDPRIGMVTPRQPGEGEGVQAGDAGASTPGAIELLKRMMSQVPMSGGQFPRIAPPPQMAQAAPVAPQAVSPSERVAQAMMPSAGGDPGAGPWGASLSQADAATRAGPSMEQLMQAASDPWVAQKYGGIIEALLQQKLKASDPLTQLQIEKAKRELAMPPERKTVVVNGRLVDAQTGQEIASFPDAQDPFTLSPGEIRFGPDGKQIAAGGDKPPTLPSAVQEYEYAKGQGFPGTFADWEASKKGGMSLQVDPATGQVTFQQGANIKPLTEGQSKDTVFTTKAEGSLPIIDKFGDALTSLGESVGGNVPVLGNYMKSPEYQQAEQAGQEFLMAILRKETGAAITDGEMKLYGDLYLPRPGDAPEKLLQKKASRARAVEAIKAGMPPQAILYVEKALAKEREAKGINPAVPPATETPPPPPPPTGGVLQNGLKWSIEP